MVNRKALFEQYTKSNVQLGLADIFEVECLGQGISLTTNFHNAQIGLVDSLTIEKVQNFVCDKFSYAGEIQTHVSCSKDNQDGYIYYLDLKQNILGVSLVNISNDKTRVTTISTNEVSELIKNIYDEIIRDDHHPCYVLISSPGGINETRRSIRKSQAPEALNCFYPFLRTPLQKYFDDFLSSDDGILILIGPAGTGKSTFGRSMILHSGKPASLVYDADTITDIRTLDHFYDSDHSILMLEDADAFIGKREEGNKHLAGYLNYADGIVKDRTKKIVISTNLGSVSKIDQALIRKGRCYDILTFGELNQEQIDEVRKQVGLEPKQFSKSVVLAEALDKGGDEREQARQHSVGFTPS